MEYLKLMAEAKRLHGWIYKAKCYRKADQLRLEQLYLQLESYGFTVVDGKKLQFLGVC